MHQRTVIMWNVHRKIQKRLQAIRDLQHNSKAPPNMRSVRTLSHFRHLVSLVSTPSNNEWIQDGCFLKELARLCREPALALVADRSRELLFGGTDNVGLGT